MRCFLWEGSIMAAKQKTKALMAQIAKARDAAVPATEYSQAWVARDPQATPQVAHPTGSSADGQAYFLGPRVRLWYTEEAGWQDADDWFELG